MKHIKSLVLFIALALAGCVQVHAQTNTPTFLETAQGYFSSFNTNLYSTFNTHKLTVFTGAEQNQGNNTAALLGATYDVYTTSNALSYGVDAVFKNAGIGGTLLGAQGGLAIGYSYVDVRLTGFIDGGYDNTVSKPYAEFGVRIYKAATVNTFYGIGISYQFKKQTPNLQLFTGFRF